MDKKDPIDVAIGAEIRKRRRAARLSLETLGHELGVTYQQVQKYEKGVNRVSAATLIKLGSILPGGLSAIVEAATGADGTAGLADVEDQVALDSIVAQLNGLGADTRRSMLAAFSTMAAGAAMGRAA